VGSRLLGGRQILVVLAVVLAAGCYFGKYDKLTRTHVQLLLSMAQKLDEVTREQGAPPASLAEYRYPLERARDFTRIVGGRFEGRASLAAFRTFCDAYDGVVKTAESLRGEPDTDATLARARATLEVNAAAVLRALDAEARS
jgi:hypothetical protein